MKLFTLNKDLNLKYDLKLNDSIVIQYPRKISNDLYLKIGYRPINANTLLNDESFRILTNKIIEMRLHKLTYYIKSIERLKTILKLIEREYPVSNK
jgi:hypothetical protein